MPNLRLAIDDNLGLPAGFSDGLAEAVRESGTFAGCELVSFHDIGGMIKAFEKADVAMMFGPAGTLPYLVARPKIIAEATFGPQRVTALCSHLLMRCSDTLVSPAEIARRKIGCVNIFCTTSYWAPLIVWDEQRAAQRPKSIDFHQATGFDDMLFSVIDGRTDAAMVWDAVLARNPNAVSETRTLAKSVDLPTPLLLANDLLTDQAHAVVADFATRFKSNDWRGFFNGFTTPNRARLDRFRDAMARATRTFGLWQ